MAAVADIAVVIDVIIAGVNSEYCWKTNLLMIDFVMFPGTAAATMNLMTTLLVK